MSPVRIQVPLPFIKFGHCPFPYSNGPVVKRLRLRPFTAATRVRVPSGSPPYLLPFPYGGIAQPVERPPHTRKVTDSSSVVSTMRRTTPKRCGSFAILDRSAGDRLQRVRSQILVMLSTPKQKAVAKATAFCFGFRLCRLHPPAITMLGRSEFCLRRRPEGRDRGGSAGDRLQSLFLRRRKMRCSRIFLSACRKRSPEGDLFLV